MSGESLDAYLPRDEWFARREHYGVHGFGHIARVLVWTARLTEHVERPLRLEELLWAAGLHDIRRLDDGVDRGHGARAAEWVRTEFPRQRPDVAAMLDLDLVAALCREHERHDHDITAWTDELRVFKDADGLDRVRLSDLDPRRLRLPVSRSLIDRARELMKRSYDLGNDAVAVREAATAMGLWRKHTVSAA
jgi:uncharacterized protein